MRLANLRTLSACVALLALGAVTGLSSLAAAQDEAAVEVSGGYPIAVAQRPLTLNQGLLRIDAGLGFAKLCVSAGPFSGCSDVIVGLGVGAGFGITDDFELGATVLPLTLSPEFRYGDPSIYGMYRFVEGQVEVGARMELWLPVENDFRLQFGVPVEWKATPTLALHTGGFLMIVASKPAQAVISIPVALIVNATESFWLGISTGLAFAVTDPGPGDTLVVPLGLQLGYAIPGATGAPLVDLVGSFEFSSFLGARDGFSADIWVAGIGARIYLDTSGG